MIVDIVRTVALLAVAALVTRRVAVAAAESLPGYYADRDGKLTCAPNGRGFRWAARRALGLEPAPAGGLVTFWRKRVPALRKEAEDMAERVRQGKEPHA